MTFKYFLRHCRYTLSMSIRWLLENQLYVKAEKCIFHAGSVPFLGQIISAENVKVDPAKVRAVSEWPVPDSRRALQRFLGFGGFIQNYSQTGAPTSTCVPFRWTEQAQGAFTKLKSCFTSAPVLSVPDSDLQFIVEVDAAEVRVGAVLSQRFPSHLRLMGRKVHTSGGGGGALLGLDGS